MEEWFDGLDGPPALFAGRVLPFDQEAAMSWAQLLSDGTAIGKSRNAIDMITAATAIANNCVIVTDNEKDFQGLKILNPMCPTG